MDLVTGQQAADLGPDVNVRFVGPCLPEAPAPIRAAGVGQFLTGPDGPSYEVVPGVVDADHDHYAELGIARDALLDLADPADPEPSA